jgi:hypothetical protein
MFSLDHMKESCIWAWFSAFTVGVVSGLVVFAYYMYYYRASYPFDFPRGIGSDLEVIMNAVDMLFLALAPVAGILFGLVSGLYFFSLTQKNVHEKVVEYVMWVGASFASFYCALTGLVLFDFIFQNVHISDTLIHVLNPFSFAGLIGALVLIASFWFIYRTPCTKECAALVVLAVVIPCLIPRTMGIDAYTLLLFVTWQTVVVLMLSRALIKKVKASSENTK